MRNLIPEEIAAALDINGEPDEGCVAVEATVNELAKLGVRTVGGHSDNDTFRELADSGFGKRKCRGWYLAKDLSEGGKDDQTMWGKFHVEVSEELADKVEHIAKRAGGSLRLLGPSTWPGFHEYEIE
jgi:hypothetical protein